MIPGMDTIDVSDVDSVIGYFYYGSNTSVLSDMTEMIRQGMLAKDRPRLKERTLNGSPTGIIKNRQSQGGWMETATDWEVAAFLEPPRQT